MAALIEDILVVETVNALYTAGAFEKAIVLMLKMAYVALIENMMKAWVMLQTLWKEAIYIGEGHTGA
jgi:hypothetical protein